MKKLTQAQKIDAIYAYIIGGNDELKKHVSPKYQRIGKFEVYDREIGVMTYNDAVKAVEKLGDGWRIPTLEELRIMYKNKDNTYCTSYVGSGYQDRYWSSTPDRDYTYLVAIVRFSDGYEFWDSKDSHRLSCRPVRLSPV